MPRFLLSFTPTRPQRLTKHKLLLTRKGCAATGDRTRDQGDESHSLTIRPNRGLPGRGIYGRLSQLVSRHTTRECPVVAYIMEEERSGFSYLIYDDLLAVSRWKRCNHRRKVPKYNLVLNPITRLCGTKSGKVIRSPSFNFIAEFFTNPSRNYKGFNISFTPATTSCHQVRKVAYFSEFLSLGNIHLCCLLR